MNLDQHADAVQRLAAGLTYTAGGGLMLGDALQWLNNNAGAVGAIMVTITTGVNWYYQRKRIRQGEQAAGQD
ncbi:phage holin family protein [Marinobacterium lutimaris]|uniref:Bacteriophage holin family HP1 n=1 Tax=Marinobacterium lutimaris TaxID=568106 RepID=A0A1H5XUA8_9GAMM|nr:hypothetical protein [Marinobacterium lutimaris]SEG15233.1 hypothetical protein SAMN05444390_1011505 [Marinobacterium lutimaris]